MYLHDVAMYLHDVAMYLHDVAMYLHDVAMYLHDVAMYLHDVATYLYDVLMLRTEGLDRFQGLPSYARFGRSDHTQKRHRTVAREMYRVECRGVKGVDLGRTMGTRIENTVATGQRSTASTSTLPKLTPAERTLIFDHQGCFKCQQLYIGHKGANCPNGFPLPGSYKTLTTTYAEAVRDGKNEARSHNLGPVAHVGFSLDAEAGELPSAVLGMGEEESDDVSMKYVRAHDPPPFSLGHLEWRCQMDRPLVSGPVTVTTLIDNGSPSVLIDEGLVARLGLRRRKLPSLHQARLAMGDGAVGVGEAPGVF